MDARNGVAAAATIAQQRLFAGMRIATCQPGGTVHDVPIVIPNGHAGRAACGEGKQDKSR
jgi:hypothetical protein